MKKSVSAAERYLSREPIVNSYQLARLEEDGSEVFVDDETDPTGVLILKDEIATLRGSYETGKELLNGALDQSEEYRFHAIDPNSFKAVQEVIEVEDDSPTWLLRREYEKAREPENEVVPLKENDAKTINEYWGLSSSNSTDYIKERIEKGPAYGIRKEGELVGWCLTHFITDETMMFGMLHIKEDWRREGFAKDITEVLCAEAEENDLVPAVQIFKDNEASLSLASDLGFEIRADHHWFDGVKK